MDKSMLEKFSIDQLYEWVSKQYQSFADGKMSETDYQNHLDYYKARLAKDEETKQDSTNAKTSSNKIEASKVRTTSVAGLRKKLLDEIRGND